MNPHSWYITKHRLWIPAILWMVVMTIIYLPLILQGGIIIDDWGGVDSNFDCPSVFNVCILERYQDAFLAVFANRPLAPLPIVLSTVLFKTNFSYYLIANTAIFLIAVVVASMVISEMAGKIAAITFAFVAPIPLISMPLVVSPINLMDSTCAYLYWAISLYLLLQFCKKKSWAAYFGSYLLLICGFFTYEVLLPLLVINALLPLLYDEELIKRGFKSYLIKFILPLFAVLAVVFLWQKAIGPHFFVFVSRLNFHWKFVIPSFLSWIDVFAVDMPILFKKSRNFLNPSVIFGSATFISCLLLSWIYIGKHIDDSSKAVFRYLLTGTLCFVATSFIFILSGATAEIGGYGSRALSSTWLGFAFFISCLINFCFHYRSWILRVLSSAVVLTLLYYSCLSFLIQRDNYIKSWEMQLHVIDDVLSLIKSNPVEKNAFIVANVPSILPKNYNDELVFDTYWDFPAALRILTNRFIGGGIVFDAKNSKFHSMKVENGILHLEGSLSFRDFERAWLYDYDQSLNKGKLTKVQNARDLKRQIESTGVPQDLGELDNVSNIEPGEVINFSYDWVKRGEFIKNGFAERESWGVWSQGSEADLFIPMPLGKAKGLRMDVRAFVAQANPVQRVKVTVNGKKQYVFSFNKFNGNFIDIPISKEEIEMEKTLRLHFQFMNAASPAQLGVGKDDRKLAIGFEKAVYY